MLNKEIADIRPEDIKRFIDSLGEAKLYMGNARYATADASSEAEWKDCIRIYQKEIAKLYHNNVMLMKEVYEPFLQHRDELSEEQYLALYDGVYDMYYNSLENPFTLLQIMKILIPHFEKKQDKDHLVFCYNCEGYSYLEISRTGDDEAGKRAVECYRKVLSCKDETPNFTIPTNRVMILLAYVNLISTSFSLGHIAFMETCHLWDEFYHYYEDYHLADYAKETPRIIEVHDLIDSRFFMQAYAYYHECLKDTDPNKLLNKIYAVEQLPFDEEIDDKLWKATMREMELHLNNDNDPLHNSAEVYSEYKRCMLYRGLQTPTEAWKDMYHFTIKHIYDHGVLSSNLSDPVGSISNPIEMMTALLPQCDFSDSMKEEICEEFCDILLEFGYKYREHSYTANFAMKEFFFETPVLSLLRKAERKQARMMELVISRHISTHLHSKMVSLLAHELLMATIEEHPEYLIGLLDTKSKEDVVNAAEKLEKLTEKAAILHDVGKNAQIDIITTEYRPIGDYEFSIIKQHPSVGAAYLCKDQDFTDVADVAHGHHKFYNGNGGYPTDFDNLASPVKPLIDLITLCDCMDAATDNIGRNYHRVKTYEELLDEFEQGAGTRYHPGYVALLATNQTLKEKIQYLITTERAKQAYRIQQHFREDSHATSRRKDILNEESL